MGYTFTPAHPGYNMVTMRQLAMRYNAGENLASIATDLASPTEAVSQVSYLTYNSKGPHTDVATGCSTRL